MTPEEANDLAKKILERIDRGKVGKARQPAVMRANIARLIEQETAPKPPYHVALETLCVQLSGGMSAAMVRAHLEPLFVDIQSIWSWIDADCHDGYNDIQRRLMELLTTGRSKR